MLLFDNASAILQQTRPCLRVRMRHIVRHVAPCRTKEMLQATQSGYVCLGSRDVILASKRRGTHPALYLVTWFSVLTTW